MSKYLKILTKTFLKKEYIINRKSMLHIANIVGCGETTINRTIRKHGISRRTPSESLKGSKQVTVLSKILTKEFLYKEYIVNKKSIRQIAKEINCSFCGVRYNLKKDNILIRTMSEADIGKKHTELAKKKIGLNSKSRWQNKEYREKTIKAIFAGRRFFPNKPEIALNKLLNKLLPKEYIFVGNGKIFISGFVPDFINCNGQKKIIEMFGDYWHTKKGAKEKDKRRIIAYKKLGYKTLIIWEHELKDLEQVENRILEFNKKGVLCQL